MRAFSSPEGSVVAVPSYPTRRAIAKPWIRAILRADCARKPNEQSRDHFSLSIASLKRALRFVLGTNHLFVHRNSPIVDGISPTAVFLFACVFQEWHSLLMIINNAILHLFSFCLELWLSRNLFRLSFGARPLFLRFCCGLANVLRCCC